MNIAVIDYDMGNVGSVLNMFKKLGVAAELTHDVDRLARADGLVLPGVGAFDRGMERLHERGLVDPLHDLVRDRRKPFLGICLGMQLMGRCSAEGHRAGLGWIDAEVQLLRRDAAQPHLRVPHMGWNFVTVINDADPLLQSLPPHPRFYFVHSYFFPAGIPAASATTRHIVPFTSVVAHDNLHGCQFHPEKSHSFGLHLLRNFARLASTVRTTAGFSSP
jgi:glutamine amidotransferase